MEGVYQAMFHLPGNCSDLGRGGNLSNSSSWVSAFVLTGILISDDRLLLFGA